MIDQEAVVKLIEQEITTVVSAQLDQVFESNDWLLPIEQKIINYTQDRILGKFSNSGALPEIVDAVKTSVTELFSAGLIPGIDKFIDHEKIRQTIDLAVETTIETAIDELGRDPAWLTKIESLINQSVVQRTVSTLGSMDINSIIKQRVDENITRFQQSLLENFNSTGIDDKATACQLTVMDETTVVENRLTAHSLEIVHGATIKDLAVTGSINVDNTSWNTLANTISEKTLQQIDEQWRSQLVNQVRDSIRNEGIDFETVKVGNEYLIAGKTLSSNVTESNLQKVGRLTDLTVVGSASFNNNTVTVLKSRLGVNTESPESALSVWDEEVSIVACKYKNQEGYIGTSRNQAMNIGINKDPQVTLNTDGVTGIKKLRVGQHRISHNTEVPNWSGTKGDVVFNAAPSVENPVFAWVCLGNFKWKVIRAVE